MISCSKRIRNSTKFFFFFDSTGNIQVVKIFLLFRQFGYFLVFTTYLNQIAQHKKKCCFRAFCYFSRLSFADRLQDNVEYKP